MAKFISLFAGVGGFDLGMEQAGHECVAQVEWDKHAAGVLKHRWPNVPLFCDVSKVSADDLPDADFITYGFPCQDLSVAGKREGLDGKRSGLFYEATRLIRELRTRGCGLRFAVAENVGGLFSADDGVALARCIRELLDSGACETGWRLLDSQYFGVAQRRKRVFIVSDFGGESVDEILAITESLPGHPAPSRETGKGTAGDAGESVGEGGDGVEGPCYENHPGDSRITDAGETCPTITKRCGTGGGNLPLVRQQHSVVSWDDTTPKASEDVSQGVDVYSGLITGEIGCTVTTKTGVGDGSGPKVMSFAPSDLKRGFGQKPEIELSGTLKKAHNDQSPHVVTSQQGGEGVGVAHSFYPTAGQDFPLFKEMSPTIKTGSGGSSGNPPGIIQEAKAFTASDRSNKAAWEGDISGTKNCQMNSESSNLQMGVRENLTVRRLTPIECERLQGFPDNWTSEKMELTLEGNEWKATGKVVKQADGPRYKAMGNAVTVNVAEWIGKQIGKVLS